METLYNSYYNLIEKLKPQFRRNFVDSIDWSDRLIGIKGARGVGKTTLMLQYIKEKYGKDKSCIYVSLDNIYFSSNTLVGFAGEFEKKGGNYLFLDEIHKYGNWSQELKNIYDSYPDLHVVFTGSSVLHIHSGNADLSRRAVVYSMEGLSFREFLEIETGKKFAPVKLTELIKNHVDIAGKIVAKVRPLAHFSNYLKYGHYPFFLESRNTYPFKLLNTVNLSLEVDIPFVNQVDWKYIEKLKKLLYVLATSVPFQPNITKLAESIGASRQTTLLYLDYLKDARMIHLLKPKSKGYSYMTKPEKIYLHNPNLMFAIAPGNTDTGALRETFFYNQLAAVAKVESPEYGDFLVDGKFSFEVGGKSKNHKQIWKQSNSYIAADMLEYGNGNKIPLWLFGFLY